MPGFPEKVALGKQEYKYDPRTIVLGAHLQPEAAPPEKFDYDHGKKPFPLDPWGNDENGDCVFVMEANGLVRVERAESHRTIAIDTDVVLGKYRALTGSQLAGDAKDEGYVILDALGDWRNAGWVVGKHDYKIEAYGELDKNNPDELRRAIWLLGGIHAGFGLPAYLQGLVSRGERTWDVQEGPEAEPYSWGGHAMYGKRYDKDGIYFLTWGEEVYLTNAFISRYMDEVWAVVDALDAHSRYLDVDALSKILRGLASNVEGG
jgi:hypothetical protein